MSSHIACVTWLVGSTIVDTRSAADIGFLVSFAAIECAAQRMLALLSQRWDAMKDASVKAEMLIRRPPGEVFSAFANPQVIRKFWLADTSGPLAPGARVLWHFMVPGATENVFVTGFESPRRIAFDWSNGMHVELVFEPYDGDATHVIVTVSGFKSRNLLTQSANVVEGFTVVLCDLKTLLETGTSANLVRDKAQLLIRALAEK
jgi:uncharacterized protein YndB with AHSA1/START domain